MPALQPLTQTTKDAVGPFMAKRYVALQVRSATESLRDDSVFGQYVDDVITRYKRIEATSPHNEAMKTKKEGMLLALKDHTAQISVLAFSKPEDVAAKMNSVGFEADNIQKVASAMEQPGSAVDDLLAIVSSVATLETSSAGAGGHHHHAHGHHHHHDHGHHGHHHGHW